MRTAPRAERVNFAQSRLAAAWIVRFCVWPALMLLAADAVSSGS